MLAVSYCHAPLVAKHAETLRIRRYDVLVYLYYHLPTKHLAPLEIKRDVAAALAALLEQLGADEYATICRTPEVEEMLRNRATELGLTVLAAGLRDVILPGDMKELMNKVTEARKAAEANLVTRREETAALRSQANTAKLMADNPILMRLRELEVIEKVAANGKLNVVLGEKGLADRIVNLV